MTMKKVYKLISQLKTMNTMRTPRNSFIHLYNPKKEGLGNYDINYINANKKLKKQKPNRTYERNAA